MKTYKQFKDFVSKEKYWAVRWCFIRQDAIKAGFNGHLFDFYKWVSQSPQIMRICGYNR